MEAMSNVVYLAASILAFAVLIGLFISPLMIWHNVSAARKEQRERLDAMLRGMQYVCDKLAE